MPELKLLHASTASMLTIQYFMSAVPQIAESRRECAENSSMTLRKTLWLWLFGVLLIFSSAASGDTEYYRHVILDNSLTPDAYFYSSAIAKAGSFIEQSNS